MNPLPKEVPLFRREAVVHRADALFGGILLPQPKWQTHLIRIIALLTAGLVTLMLVGGYTKRTRATGYTVLTPGPARISSPATGLIASIHAHNGETVKRGQLLMEIAKARASAGLPDVEAEILSHVREERAQLEHEISIVGELSAASQRSADREIESLQASIERLRSLDQLAQEKLRLAEADAARTDELVKGKWLAQKALDDANNAVLVSKIASKESEQRLHEQESELATKRSARSSLPLQLQQQRSELQAKLATLDEQIAETESAGSSAVYAPIDGVVSGENLNVGESVGAGSELLTVVPVAASFGAQMLVPSKDAGFLRAGMEVWIRYDAFPYQKFGQYKGSIKSVDLTVLTPEQQTGPVRLNEPAYRAVVTLDQQSVDAYGRPVALQSGLTFEAAISQGHQRIVDLVLEPLNAARRGLY